MKNKKIKINSTEKETIYVPHEDSWRFQYIVAGLKKEKDTARL